MIQQLNPGPTISQAFGKGLTNTFEPQLQRSLQMSQLQRALEPLQSKEFENQSYTQQLGQLLPALLSTPGGAQLAGELAPVLNQRAQNQSYLRYLDERKDQRNQSKKQQIPSISNATGENLGVQVEGPDGEISRYGYRNPEEQKYRNPQAYKSPESTTPLQTMQNQAAIPLTADQIQDEIENIIRSSTASGKPISYGEANQIVQQDQANRLKQNELLENEKQRREESYDKRMSEGVAQARNSGIIETPEDEPIFKKFLEEGKGEKNSTEQYIQAKNKFNKFSQARDSIKRSFSVPNAITGTYRKMMGSYKGKEQIIRDLQPNIKIYKELGLIDELRNDLSETVGLGTEDTETAIFPPTKQQRTDWNNIPINRNQPKEVESFLTSTGPENVEFPGDDFMMPRDQFSKFKENLYGHLQKYPETNLTALRGFLNQDRKYAWQDISNAFNELMEEGRFKPDQLQLHEMNIIQNAPIPGLAELFDHLLTDTK
jgi:hypothetical protein